MPTQTQYRENLDRGREGAIDDTNEKTLISRNADENITFGKPVTQGAMDRSCKLSAAGDTAILGISVRERSACDDMWEQYESVRIMTEGTIWVVASAAVVAGDEVHVILASQEFANAGDVQIPNARFEDTAAAGELVRVRWS